MGWLDRQRYLAMVRKEFLQQVRDPNTLRILIAAPILQMILLGYAVTSDVKDVRVAVLDLDRSAESREAVDHVRNTGYFRLRSAGSQRELLHLLDTGAAQATLQIPPGFSRRLQRGETSPVQLMVDGSDTNTATLTMAYVSGALRRFAGGIQADFIRRRGGASASAVDVRSSVWYNPALLSRFYIVPGIVALLLNVLASSLTVLSVAREREVGTLEQIMVTPLSTWEFMLAKMTPPAVLSYASGLIVISLSVLWFRVPFRGHPLLLLASMAPFLLTSLGFGLLMSSVARNQQQAMLLNFFYNLPQILLSGFMFPISTMPAWAQGLSLLVPMRHFLVIVRGIYLKGSGPAALWPAIWALLALSAVVFILGVRTFRRRLD